MKSDVRVKFISKLLESHFKKAETAVIFDTVNIAEH